MPDANDHDLLIRIDETTRGLREDLWGLSDRVDAVDGKVATLRIESSANGEKLRGISTRIAWLWAIILAIVTGGAAALIAIAREVRP
jgi:hypothetical protein